eukprot:CAMPEP_0203635964 /NCGR_PEP_ID=MMETSP0088-20131115/2616_1 /ASSEMBLY_ACC=CAM_ASM_001087 /TAXON_ID=426623 /ORGANISM="Chaetoceros affinis, Strain CCMP159" /LENGTH=77 /DNA_ID=CAMNT_0050489975 /DNA_START=21 /DNA_END=254 /DNA_ORIENTATION=-
MSGKGSSSTSNNNSSSSSGGGSGYDYPSSEPTIISGWEHSTYATNGSSYSQERYTYIGKDEETGEPEWLDYGPKGGR